MSEAFTTSNVFFTALGAALFWSVRGRYPLRVFALSSIIEQFGIKDPWLPRLEIVIFLIVGCLIGITFVEPENGRQALTAGFGWTSVMVHSAEKASLSKKNEEG